MNAIEKINYPDNLQLRHHHDDEIAELENWMRLGRNDDNVTLSSLHNAIIMNEKLDSLIRNIFN